ncbi:MAG: hypothetical protein ABW090_01030 [Sedimenticola sp.]
MHFNTILNRMSTLMLRPNQLITSHSVIDDLAVIHTGLTYLVRNARSYSSEFSNYLCLIAPPLVVKQGKERFACIGNCHTVEIAAQVLGWDTAIPMKLISRASDNQIREFYRTEIGRAVGHGLDPVGQQLRSLVTTIPESDLAWIFPGFTDSKSFAEIVSRDEKTLRAIQDETPEVENERVSIGLPEIQKQVRRGLIS